MIDKGQESISNKDQTKREQKPSNLGRQFVTCVIKLHLLIVHDWLYTVKGRCKLSTCLGDIIKSLIIYLIFYFYQRRLKSRSELLRVFYYNSSQLQFLSFHSLKLLLHKLQHGWNASIQLFANTFWYMWKQAGISSYFRSIIQMVYLSNCKRKSLLFHSKELYIFIKGKGEALPRSKFSFPLSNETIL